MDKRTIALVSGALAACAAALALLWLLGGGMSARAALAVGTVEGPAGELRVCPSGCAYSSVQAAVDDAETGDVIKVAQGTYSDVHVRDTVTQVVYISKTVTLRGGYTRSNWQTADPTAHPTTLDAQHQGRVLYIARGIDPAIEGLRLTGGDAARLGGEPGLEYDTGGGVYIYRSAPTLANNWIVSNTAQRGGGLYLYEDEAILQSNMILSNTTSHLGGGLYLDCSEGALISNRIAANRAGSYGGGLGVWAGDPTLLGNVIAGNQAESHGGGLYLQRYDGSVRRNLLTRNESGSWGGGMVVLGGDPQLEGNRLIDNSAAEGGGLCVDGTSGPLSNHVIVGNYASTLGSALKIRDSSGLQLLHTTIASNTGGDGSGVYVTNFEEGYSTVTMTNTIIAHHGEGIHVTAGNTAALNATLWYANVSGNTGGDGAISTVHDYSGDPVFAADGYHLTLGSAARDKGVASDVTTDVDGEGRPAGAGPDLGADELAVKHVYLPLVLRDT